MIPTRMGLSSDARVGHSAPSDDPHVRGAEVLPLADFGTVDG